LAPRSTRGKIKWHVKNAIKQFDLCMSQLQACEEIANENSTFINDHLPGIIVMLDGMKVVLQQYYDML
jgi:hypothetical protein